MKITADLFQFSNYTIIYLFIYFSGEMMAMHLYCKVQVIHSRHPFCYIAISVASLYTAFGVVLIKESIISSAIPTCTLNSMLNSRADSY